MESNMQERRGAQRFRINYLMKYCKENSVARFHAFFNDISDKGLRFLSKEYLPKATPILIELHWDSQPLALNGKVVWNNALGENFYELGVSFEGVSNEHKEVLSRYIEGLKTKLR